MDVKILVKSSRNNTPAERRSPGLQDAQKEDRATNP